MRTYGDLERHLQGGRNKNRRPLQNNTYAVRRGENCIAVQLHSTDILTFYRDGRVSFNTGGWETVTTKDRINTYAPGGWRVYSERGHWYLFSADALYAFVARARRAGDVQNWSARESDADEGVKLGIRLQRRLPGEDMGQRAG